MKRDFLDLAYALERECTTPRAKIYYTRQKLTSTVFVITRNPNRAMRRFIFVEYNFVLDGSQHQRLANRYNGGKFSAMMHASKQHVYRWASNALRSREEWVVSVFSRFVKIPLIFQKLVQRNNA